MRKRAFQLVFLAVVAGGVAWYFLMPGAGRIGAGGRLVASQRTEPDSYNRLVSPKYAVELISRLTSAPLVRVNHASGALEPALATEWAASSDGLTFTLKLRQGVTFSDGVP